MGAAVTEAVELRNSLLGGQRFHQGWIALRVLEAQDC
jgi:hypothetical protein